jgi:Flp pilus assembly protein TadD
MAQDVDTKLQVSEILTENGYEKEADKIINRLLSFKYTGIENYNKIGISLRKQGKFKEAEQSYMAALNYHSDNAAIYFNMGVLHLYESKPERAAECFAKALKINPEFSKARAMFECFCRGNSGKAMAVAKTLAREVNEV